MSSTLRFNGLQIDLVVVEGNLAVVTRLVVLVRGCRLGNVRQSER